MDHVIDAAPESVEDVLNDLEGLVTEERLAILWNAVRGQSDNSSHRSLVRTYNHTQQLSNEKYSDASISAYEGYMSSPFDGAYPLVSRGWQPDQQMEPFSGAQPPMPLSFFPSLISDDLFESTYRNHPARSAPRGARISRRSLVRPGRVNSLRGRNSDRSSLGHSDRFQRLQDTRNRLPPPSPLRTRLPIRRRDSHNHPIRAAESSKPRPLLYPEAKNRASQYMRRRPASISRENTPLQRSDQAAGPDSKTGRDILDAYNVSRHYRNETIDREETSSFSNNEAGGFHRQSRVDAQDRGSPLPSISGSDVPMVTHFPADMDVEQPDSRRSPSAYNDILVPPPFQSAEDVEGAYFPSFSFFGKDEPYCPRSPDLATATPNFLSDWSPEESHLQESTDMFENHLHQAGLDTTLWDQPLAFFHAVDPILNDGLHHIAGSNAQPGFFPEITSYGSRGDTPLHENKNFPTKDPDNIINHRSRPTVIQIDRFDRSSTTSPEAGSSGPFEEDSPSLENAYSSTNPFNSVNNLHVEVAGTQISSSEEHGRPVDDDEINDDESVGTVVGDQLEIDGVWDGVEDSDGTGVDLRIEFLEVATHDPRKNNNFLTNIEILLTIISGLYKRTDSNLTPQAFQAYHDLRPVAESVDDGLAALSAMHLSEEDSQMARQFSAEKEANTSKLVSDDNSRLDIQEVNADGLGEQVLEASKKLDPTLRQAFWQAIEMHTRIVRAFLFDKDRADPRATAKRLSPLQKLLASWRRQVIQGIHKMLVPLMLAELDIVNHILIQLLPADTEQIDEVEGSPLPQHAVSSRVLDSNSAVGFDYDLEGDSVKTKLSSRGHDRVTCLNPGAQVELASSFDSVITTVSSNNHGSESAENGIDPEFSIQKIDTIDAVSEVSTSESEDTEFSFEMIDVAESNGPKG
ncbi:MAG: hypothetical protein Q9195_000718 [Heterodermia aff. obscurata]